MEFDAGRIKRAARQAVRSALYQAGGLVAEKSLERVPRKTGRLAKSVYVRVGTGNEIASEVGYSADYAAAVHEKSGAYLTRPFSDLKSSIEEIVTKSVEEAVR